MKSRINRPSGIPCAIFTLVLCLQPAQANLFKLIDKGLQSAQFFTSCMGKNTPPASRYYPPKGALRPEIANLQELGSDLGNLLDIDVPSFIVGASTSEHQCSHRCTAEHCSYARFAKQKGLVEPAQLTSMNLWDHYPAYFDYLKNNMGLNSIRFSIEWALVQPKGPKHFSREALDHYADMFCCAIKRGITPVICLHHYTDPCWFIDRGGFECKRNIPYFVSFCSRILETIMEKVERDPAARNALQKLAARPPLWATFNSPEGDAFKGYREMTLPPANPKKRSTLWAERVLANICEAHVQAYHAMHELYDTQWDTLAPLKVGFLKNIHQLDPVPNTLNPLTSVACKIGNLVQNEFIFNFFTKGTFDAPTINWYNEKAIGALDFIGLNYYSNRFMNGTKMAPNTGTRRTNNKNYAVYPMGLYRALMEINDRMAKPLDIPIYVTENGVATLDDEQRATFYRGYLNALCQAQEDGCPVWGYLTWTLCDNYEWGGTANDRRCYGLCTIPDATTPWQLAAKQGAQPLLDFANGLRSTVA